MYLLIWEYDSVGERSNLRTFANISLRNLYQNNHSGAAFFRIEPGTSVDNVRVFQPVVSELILNTTSEVVLSGQGLQFIAKGSRYGIELNLETAIYYQIYDSNDQPIDDPQIVIDNNGFLQVGQFAEEQTIFVKAIDAKGTLSNSVPVSIKSSNTLDIISLGFNQDMTEIVDLEIFKNFYYEGTAVCVIDVYDHNRILIDQATRNIASNIVPIREAFVVPVYYQLPADFDLQTWQLKVAIYSSIE